LFFDYGFKSIIKVNFLHHVFLAFMREFFTVPTPPGAKLPGLYATSALSAKILFMVKGLTVGKIGDVTLGTGLVGN
jgi:hypothetical protein